jgi:G3E family GTPase
MSAKARFLMIGGFLGAGKTTAVARLARFLADRGLSVGLITNDQSTGLVDTALLASHGFPVHEIGGGCFCCRFRSLSEAVERLTAATRPDVFVAEPVGSCTDLLATVSYPLRRIYGERYTIAPLSVLVDPLRAERILGLVPGRSFSPKVAYVYRKQLEEAELVVLNKCDLLDGARADRLARALGELNPRAEVLRGSARDGTGLEAWFGRLLERECVPAPTMALDYSAYAEGEALLGWLNATVALAAARPFDANALLRDLALDVRSALRRAGVEIAHLKLTLDSSREDGQLAVLSLVSSEAEPDLRESLLDRVGSGSLVVNLRAETDPERLERVTTGVLAARLAREPSLRWTVEHLERFRPAPPVPVHRDTVPAWGPAGAGATS